MVDRIQLKQTVYMVLDGQPQLVLAGSIIDVPNSQAFHPAHATVLSPATPAGTLVNGKATSVTIRRN